MQEKPTISRFLNFEPLWLRRSDSAGPPTKSLEHMSKQPRQKRAFETRDRILDAAESMIEQQGHADFSMNALRLKAGVSAGGLYEWFANKDAVLDSVMERHVDFATQAIEGLLETIGEMPFEQKMRLVLEAGLAMHEAKPVFHRFLFTRTTRSNEVQAKLDAFEQSMERIIEADLESNGIEAAEAGLRAAMINRASQSLLHEFVLDDSLTGSTRSRLDLIIALLERWSEPSAIRSGL